VPLGSTFVEAEDVKGTVAAFDFAITIIRTVPLVEDLDHLDPIPVQTERPGYLNPMVLADLDHDTHVPASAAARALSKRPVPPFPTEQIEPDQYTYKLAQYCPRQLDEPPGTTRIFC